MDEKAVTTEIVKLNGDHPPNALAVEGNPELVVEEAHKAAAVLKGIIDKKQKKVTFNGKTYLEYEDWQTVAKFYGVTARVKSTQFVEYGTAKGFEATAEALLVKTNQVVSQADALCLNDEENWGFRKKYQWTKDHDTGKAKRVQIGEEPVPLFQLKSMAQTRACAKALRNVFAWVVVLAGYAPTPAEEMGPLIDAKNETGSPEAQQAVLETKLAEIEKEKQSSAPKPASGAPVISEAQMKRAYAIARTAGWQDQEIKDHLKQKYGIEHTRDIPKSLYDQIVKEFQEGASHDTEEIPF